MENQKSQRDQNDYSASEKKEKDHGNERRPFKGRDKKPRFSNEDRGDRGARRPMRRSTRDGRDFNEGREGRERQGDRPRNNRYEKFDGERKPRFDNREGSRFNSHADRDGDRPRRPDFGDRDRTPRANYGDVDRKPRFERDGERNFRPRFEDRDRKPRFSRDERPRFDDRDRKPRFERDGERPRNEDRDRRPRFEDRDRKPRFDRDERPRFNRDERPRFEDRDRKPRFERDGERSFRPRFEDRDRKPRFDREERPRFDDRDRKPRFERDGERSFRPRFEDRDRKPRFDREERPRFDDHDRKPRFEERGERAHAPHSHEAAAQNASTEQNFTNLAAEGYTEFGYAYSNTTEKNLKGEDQISSGAEGGNAPHTAHEGEGAPRSYGERHDFEDRPRHSYDRGERGDRDRKRPMKRPPLRETIMTMDRDLLKMLARRCNILDRMRSKAGQMAPKEEKELRASWEKGATQMTRDTRIIHQLFALMQEITFSAKPEAGDAKRTGFNLAPPQLPVDISFFAPLASRRSRLFLALAGASGSACRMSPSLLDDATIECIKMFNQCATSLAWDDQGTLISREGGGLSLPDKVIYVGDDIFNFFLLLGHYVSQNTRAKFTGEASLKEADLTAVRSFLPQLGARLSNVMPSSSGFPIRLECSGIFEDTITIPADIPADMVLGLFMAAPFWPTAISFEMRVRPDADAIIEEAFSVLQLCGAQVRREGSLVHFAPCPIKTPAEPSLGMDLHLAAYLLALPLTVGGKVQLNGQWPDCTPAKDIEELFKHFGLTVDVTGESICASHEPIEPISWRVIKPAPVLEAEDTYTEEDEALVETATENETEAVAEDVAEAATETNSEAVAEDFTESSTEGQALLAPVPSLKEESLPLEKELLVSHALFADARFAPLMAACAYIAAVRKKYVLLPSSAPLQAMESFFNHMGFEYSEADGEECALVPNQEPFDSEAVWTAPTPAWAMAYALCAAVRPHIKLSNPGIMSTLYPQFWTLYNALPSFDIKKNVTENTHDKPVRRRIIAADQERIGSGDSND